MHAMFSYLSLLLLIICCWQCMAMHSHGNKRPPVDSSCSDESSSSEEKGASCKDHKKNRDETDIDCGGKKCQLCADEKKCLDDSDCISDFCKKGKCARRSTIPTKKTTSQALKSTMPARTTSAKVITSTAAIETTTRTEQDTTMTKEITTTMEEDTSTTATEDTTTREEDTSAAMTEEITTTTEEDTSITATEDTTTTTEEEISTATTEEITTTTTEEDTSAVTTEEITTTTLPTCDFECQNGGTCSSHNKCICTSDFSGPTCDVQSVGLCLDEETFGVEPILLITFGKGSTRFSNASSAQFNFSTTYAQRREPTIDDGHFGFINSVYNHHDAWHAGATDHTGDNGGYMYVVNANFEPGQFYSGRVDSLCVGLRYEFSVYLANICKKAGRIEPNVLFEVRSVDGNELLAQLNSGNIPEHDTLTWEKYGFSFIATNSSVNLLMISNAPGGSGNDIVIDDIALRVCSHGGNGFCPSK